MPGTVSRSRLSSAVLFGIAILILTLPLSPAHAQTRATITQYTSVIAYQTSSGFTPENVNITWTNTNTCGIFSGSGPGADWNYGPGVGATPCTGSLPGGTIVETITADGTVLASCSDTRGAATFGSTTATTTSACTDSGAGVTIDNFFAQTYDGSGTTVQSGSGTLFGNYYWISSAITIAAAVIIVVLLVMKRRRKSGPPVPHAGSGPDTPS